MQLLLFLYWICLIVEMDILTDREYYVQMNSVEQCHPRFETLARGQNCMVATEGAGKCSIDISKPGGQLCFQDGTSNMYSPEYVLWPSVKGSW